MIFMLTYAQRIKRVIIQCRLFCNVTCVSSNSLMSTNIHYFTSNMMIQFYIYMDHLFQLLRNLNSLAFYLIENSVLYPILNISKLNV